MLTSFPKNSKVEEDRIAKRGKKIVRSLQDKRIKKWRKFETNMTVGNNKNDSDILSNKKYVFPNVSYANILKQTSGMRMSSNLPAYVPPQLTSLIPQVSESNFYLTQGDQSLIENLEALCGSASASSKFVDGRIKGMFFLILSLI